MHRLTHTRVLLPILALLILVALLPSEWALKTFADKNEDWTISDQPFPPPVAAGR